ncbi:MAG: FHA domain-containing protein [Colwellia sp.]|nr:FHA domain-containing protein [Colwellia sp.]
MEIIIEEITRSHKLIARHKFSKDHVNIGRGYDNDIIMADPHICAQHLSLNYNGEEWILNDKDTVNGSFFEDDFSKTKSAVNQNIVYSGQVFALGKSLVRIIFPNHSVPESIRFSPFENVVNLTRHPLFLTLSIVLFATITGWLFNLHNPVEVSFTQILVPAVGLTLLFTLWPAGVALVSHLTKHEARFWGQLGICFVFFNLMWMSDFIENLVSFNSSSQSMFTLLVSLLPISLAFCLFWLNCYVGFHMTSKRRTVIASCLTLLLFGGSFLIQLSKKPEFSVRPVFNTTLMAPSYLFTDSNNVQGFIENAKSLFTEAQESAKKDK